MSQSGRTRELWRSTSSSSAPAPPRSPPPTPDADLRPNARDGASIEPPTVLVIEKSAEVGDHMLSGAVINPRAIAELMPDFAEQGFPTEYVCDERHDVHVHRRSAAIPLPDQPARCSRRRGYHVASLNKVAKWLAKKCEEAGIEIYAGFAATSC